MSGVCQAFEACARVDVSPEGSESDHGDTRGELPDVVDRLAPYRLLDRPRRGVDLRAEPSRPSLFKQRAECVACGAHTEYGRTCGVCGSAISVRLE